LFVRHNFRSVVSAYNLFHFLKCLGNVSFNNEAD
jgi:hypothetical protein